MLIRHQGGETHYIAENLDDLREKLLMFREETADGCWLWNRAKRVGYGVTAYKGRCIATHRAAAVIWLGLPLEALSAVICHRCNNVACFNPEHIYVGTFKTNTNDAVKGGTHFPSRETTCKHGHELTEENIIWEKGRHGLRIRRCKICHREKLHKYYVRKQQMKEQHN